VTPEELAARLKDSDVQARMEALGFSLDFVAKNVASATAEVTVAQVAMLWMGMPNKHDRKRTRQLLDALTDAGVLECVAEETYEVRPPQ
jgi:hypothetical protein